MIIFIAPKYHNNLKGWMKFMSSEIYCFRSNLNDKAHTELHKLRGSDVLVRPLNLLRLDRNKLLDYLFIPNLRMLTQVIKRSDGIILRANLGFYSFITVVLCRFHRKRVLLYFQDSVNRAGVAEKLLSFISGKSCLRFTSALSHYLSKDSYKKFILPFQSVRVNSYVDLSKKRGLDAVINLKFNGLLNISEFLESLDEIVPPGFTLRINGVVQNQKEFELVEKMKLNHIVLTVMPNASEELVYDSLRDSKFCIVHGKSLCSYSQIEAIECGCLPIIYAENNCIDYAKCFDYSPIFSNTTDLGSLLSLLADNSYRRLILEKLILDKNVRESRVINILNKLCQD